MAHVRTKRRLIRRTVGPIGVGACVWVVWPAQSLGRALVRFIQADPGAGEVTVEVGQGAATQRLAAVAFAQVSDWRGLRSGRFRWSLVSGDKLFAHGTATVGGGAYDVVLLTAQPLRVSIGVYRARGGRPGGSLIRVIHAAPELGAPRLRLGSALLAPELAYAHATGYVQAAPGTHALLALEAGSRAPLVPGDEIRLTGDRAYTAILVGSRGRRLRWVTVTDRGAPLTRAARRARGPAAHGPAGPGPAASGTLTVHPGDSLWTIAAQRLGPQASQQQIWAEVVAIWRLNAHRLGTGDPNLIFPGQRVELPAPVDG